MNTREQPRVPLKYMYTSKQVYTKPFFNLFLFTFHGIDQRHSPSKAAIADSNLQTKQQTSFDTNFSAWVLYCSCSPTQF